MRKYITPISMKNNRNGKGKWWTFFFEDRHANIPAFVRRLVTVGGVQGQPPCEAVSWNSMACMYSIGCSVSLLVRLWVEMNDAIITPPISCVSLLVRLWVEIQLLLLSNPLPVRQPPWVLRCLFGYAIIDTILVSLFERLWIEKRNTLWLLYLREN